MHLNYSSYRNEKDLCRGEQERASLVGYLASIELYDLQFLVQ